MNVTVSTFNDTDEAITKIRTGAVPYDIYFPSYDQISRLVAAQLIRPLNHTYLTNIDNVWPAFQNPWYDQQLALHVPYTVYTTGIGWRTDKVQHRHRRARQPVRHPVEPDLPRQDRGHRRLAHGDGDVPAARRQDRHQHRVARRPRADQPASSIELQQTDAAEGHDHDVQRPARPASSGSARCGRATSSTRSTTCRRARPSTCCATGSPTDGKGMVDNDLMVVLKGGQNPVLAHLFLQHMLDTKNALANFGYIGYQPPQRSLDPDTVVARGFVPKNLASAVVREEYFNVGYRLLELCVDNDAAWHKIWLAFKAGA